MSKINEMVLSHVETIEGAFTHFLIKRSDLKKMYPQMLEDIDEQDFFVLCKRYLEETNPRVLSTQHAAVLHVYHEGRSPYFILQ